MDIYDFKCINDDFGHVYGDEVLVLLSVLMKTAFRPQDLLFRYGGEEFVIIIRAPDLSVASNVVDRFRVTVAEHIFPQVGQVTVRLGATQIFSNNTTASIIGQADQALYHAKSNGKNKLFIYESLIESGELKPLGFDDEIELF